MWSRLWKMLTKDTREMIVSRYDHDQMFVWKAIKE